MISMYYVGSETINSKVSPKFPKRRKVFLLLVRDSEL